MNEHIFAKGQMKTNKKTNVYYRCEHCGFERVHEPRECPRCGKSLFFPRWLSQPVRVAEKGGVVLRVEGSL